MSIVSNVTADQIEANFDIFSKPPEEFENDHSIEAMWAVVAYQHAEVYFNILCSVDPKYLKLTPCDDQIYKTFRELFADLPIDTIDEDEMKSNKGKSKWRPFCEQFKEIENYNMGTLLRIDCTEDYSVENSILTSRIQFYAIELARNREGYNDSIRQKFKAKKIAKDLQQ